MDRRQFLGFGLGCFLGHGVALAEMPARLAPVKPVAAFGNWQTWDFHGWEAGIGPNGAGSMITLWRPDAGLAWGNEIVGQHWVNQNRQEYAAALDILAGVPVKYWNPLEIDCLWIKYGAVNSLTTWLGWTLTRPPAMKVAGIRRDWKKDPWGKVLVAMAEGMEGIKVITA